MSFRLAIPWRVDLQHDPRLRFANRFLLCGNGILLVDDFSSSGEQCLNRLSQFR
jgi:hypothetical protein